MFYKSTFLSAFSLALLLPGALLSLFNDKMAGSVLSFTLHRAMSLQPLRNSCYVFISSSDVSISFPRSLLLGTLLTSFDDKTEHFLLLNDNISM